MYNNETYEDYIRSILGYPNYNSNHFENNNYYKNDFVTNIEHDNQIETYYPKIYKIIYPMISKECASNNKPITSELIDELSEKIYNSIIEQSKNEMQVNINLTNTINTNRSIPNTNAKKPETKLETRQTKNNTLNDLIKILLIREFLHSSELNRPPMNRPPFPGGPNIQMPKNLYY